MLNQLLKFTLLSSLLLWLRPRWRSLLALIVLVVLVHVLHGEYLGYVELSGERSYLLWSYLIKWVFLIAGVLIYLFYALAGPKGLRSDDSAGSALKKVQVTPTATVDDGFDFLRKKKHLQTKAEKILTKTPPTADT